MPASPKCDGGRVVRDAADHVFWCIDAVDKRPEAEETPWDEEFEPENVQIEVAEEGELDWGVVGPVGVGFGDCDAVVEVQDYFHAEEGKEESDAVFESAFALDG